MSSLNGSTAETLLSWTMAPTGVRYYDIRRIPPGVSTGAPGRTYDEVFYVAEVDQVRDSHSDLGPTGGRRPRVSEWGVTRGPAAGGPDGLGRAARRPHRQPAVPHWLS